MLRWFLSLPFKLLYSLLRLVSVKKQRRLQSPAQAAKQYIIELESNHGSSHVPIFEQSYKSALDKAKQDLRFLMVVLTSAIHPDTPAMQALLCDDNLKSYILDHDILVWCGNVAELEAYRVSLALGASRYPFVGLIVYNTLREATMTCVSRLEGLPSVIDLMSHLQASIDRYEPTLISLKVDRRQQNHSREIRAEQDSAYEISLRKDREKAELRRKEEEEHLKRQQEMAEQSNNAIAWRQWKHKTLPEEPETNKNVARISFRMPSGARCVRKFSADSTTGDIYAWVDLYLHPVEDVEESIIHQPPINYEPQYSFTIAVPMPRTILLASSSETLAQKKEIFPSGSLIVEMNEASP